LAVENYACALGNVYTFGPTFRAENSHTTRHLAEFWMIEPEIAFADLDDNMNLAEDYLKYCLKYVLLNNKDDIDYFVSEEKRANAAAIKAKTKGFEVKENLEERLLAVANTPFKRITYTECIDLLMEHCKAKKVKFAAKPTWGIDMNSEHERYLAEKVFKQPIIVYNYPLSFKSFYMKRNEDGKTCQAMDVLVPYIGEMIGGSVREENLEKLDQTMKEKGLSPEPYWWYRELRMYGTVPHAGFGLGFERLVMMCTGVENIRDVIPFPRYPGKAEF
jgi:asparaginyl-tRNA synthetase